MNLAPAISLDSVARLSDHQLSCEVANEVVVLETARGQYYGLNAMAAFVWNALKQPIKVSAVRDAILEEFEVAEEECERDLLTLLKDFQENGLLTVDQ